MATSSYLNRLTRHGERPVGDAEGPLRFVPVLATRAGYFVHPLCWHFLQPDSAIGYPAILLGNQRMDEVASAARESGTDRCP